MSQSREKFLQLSHDYLGNFVKIQQLAYEHPEYQKQFKRAEELIQFIVSEYKAGHLSGKDLYDSTLDLPSLFKGCKNQTLKEEALQLSKEMDKAVNAYLRE